MGWRGRSTHGKRPLAVESLEGRRLLAAIPIISEFMAVNDTVLTDGHGDSSDWIELYNAGDTALNLDGWYLTDDPQHRDLWRFPAIELGAARFLVVYASGKGTDRYFQDDNGGWHTDFQLQDSGGYLALIAPDGESVASSFGPDYPAQVADISFGLPMRSESLTLITPDSPGNLHFPQDDRLGSQWSAPDFVTDDAWLSVTPQGEPVHAAIGFQASEADPRLVAHWPLNEPVGTLGVGTVQEPINHISGTPFGAISFGSDGANIDSATASTGTGTNGGIRIPWTGDLQQPSFSLSVWARPHRNSGVHAVVSSRSSEGGDRRGYSLHNSSGRWQFLTGDGANWDTLTGPLVVPNQWVHLAITFDAATGTKRLFVNGQQSNSTTLQQYIPQATQDFYIGAGEDQGTSFFFDGDIDEVAYFREVLTPAAIQEVMIDGLNSGSTRLIPHIETNVESLMRGHNSSAYLRIPFQLEDAEAVDQLILNMRYDDGFVALINGIPVVSRNVPAVVTWNANATTARTDTQALTRETFDLSAFTHVLRDGTNVLAFQALNVSASDIDFLLAPELTATSVTLNSGNIGHFSQPTPNGLNSSASQLRIADEVIISHPSQTFAGSISVSLTTTASGGSIYYTTDGSVPSLISPVYTGPISIDRSSQLRARLMALDTISGPIVSASYLKLSAEVQGFASNLPLLVIDNFGAGSVPNSGWNQTNTGIQQVARQTASMMLFDTSSGSTNVSQYPNTASRIGIRVRGAFSSTFAEPGYSMETWRSDSNQGAPLSLLGLAADSDWILYAPNPSFDETLIDNSFLFEISQQMGHWTPKVRYVEAFLNTDGDAVTMEDYVGIYVITEKVKRTEDRLDFAPFLPDGTDGGWLLDINRLDPISEEGETPKNFHTAGPDGVLQTPRDLTNSSSLGDDIPRQYNAYINYDEPSGYDITESQRDSIDAWFHEMETVLYNRQPNVPWNDPANGYAKYIDVENFIDYFILNNLSRNGDGLLISLWIYNPDPANGGKLRFGPIWDVDLGSYSGDPTTELFRRADQLWYPRLFEDPNFQQAYIDRWQELRGDILSDSGMSDVIDAWFQRIGNAAAVRDGVTNWSARLSAMKNWLASRAAAIDDTFVLPPALSHPGGTVPVGFEVGIGAESGEIVYTLDGTDPRLPGGTLSPTAHVIGVDRATLVPLGAAATAIIPTATLDAAIGSSWAQLGFVEGNAGEVWRHGPTGVGYDTETTYRPLLGIDLGDADHSVYVRVSFQADAMSLNGVGLLLNMQYDDGFIAYLNGVEVARANAPGLVGEFAPYNATATLNHEAGVGALDSFNISQHAHLLRTGSNLLAIHALNVNASSSDMIVRPELVLSRTDANGIVLSRSTTVVARVRIGTGWSGPSTATYLIDAVPVAPGHIVVSEINYHPSEPTARELEDHPGVVDNDFEFLELWNVSHQRIDLAGARFSFGIDFQFPQFELAPDGRVIIARNPDAFRIRYGNTVSSVGPFNAGQLDNGGERIQLQSATGQLLAEIDYNDDRPWPPSADGWGATLEWIGGSTSQLSPTGGSTWWRGSSQSGGSPGDVGLDQVGVVINEVRSRSNGALGERDAIELFNRTDHLVDISGWYLSDSASNMFKYLIPAGTTIAPGAYLVFDEEEFNPTPQSPLPNHFALNGDGGDDLWLVAPATDGRVRTFVDQVNFGASHAGETWAQFTTIDGTLLPSSRPTLGCQNTSARVGPIVISGIHAVPDQPNEMARAHDPRITVDELEYLTIHNSTLRSIDLSGWSLNGDVDMVFDPETFLAPYEHAIVVSFAPDDTANANLVAAFRAQYGVPLTVRLIGGYAGQLNDQGGLLELQRLESATDTTPTVLVTEDLVLTNRQAGSNVHMALHRRSPMLPGLESSSWQEAVPSPGETGYVMLMRGDTTGDGELDVRDIDTLADAIHTHREVALFDLNNDRQIDWDDYLLLYRDILRIIPGDSNADGQVDGVDMIVWNSNRFQSCRSSWADGDWNGDRMVDGSDWNKWNEHRFEQVRATSENLPTARPPRAALGDADRVARVRDHIFALDRQVPVLAAKRWDDALKRRQGDR